MNRTEDRQDGEWKPTAGDYGSVSWITRHGNIHMAECFQRAEEGLVSDTSVADLGIDRR